MELWPPSTFDDSPLCSGHIYAAGGSKKNCSADRLPGEVSSAVSAQALSFCGVCRGREFEKGAVVLLRHKALPRQQTEF